MLRPKKRRARYKVIYEESQRRMAAARRLPGSNWGPHFNPEFAAVYGKALREYNEARHNWRKIRGWE